MVTCTGTSGWNDDRWEPERHTRPVFLRETDPRSRGMPACAHPGGSPSAHQGHGACRAASFSTARSRHGRCRPPRRAPGQGTHETAGHPPLDDSRLHPLEQRGFYAVIIRAVTASKWHPRSYPRLPGAQDS